MREIVHIQGGQCGNQISAKLWEVGSSTCCTAAAAATLDAAAEGWLVLLSPNSLHLTEGGRPAIGETGFTFDCSSSCCCWW